MKLQLSILSTFFLTTIIVASLVIPLNLALPYSASADPGIMKWDTVTTPGSVAGKLDIANLHGAGANTGKGSEILDMVAGNDGTLVYAVVRTWFPVNTVAADPAGKYKNLIRSSKDSGISWGIPFTDSTAEATAPDVFQVVAASDDRQVFVITTADYSGLATGPKMVWITTNATGGGSLVYDGTGLDADETIRCVDVSTDYGGRRDIAFGTVNRTPGSNGGRWAVISTAGFSNLNVQDNANGTPADPIGTPSNSGIDYHCIKFSPNYAGDGSAALVYATSNATYYNVAFRDLSANATPGYAFQGDGIEVRNPAAPPLSSPGWDELNMADLQIPSDFSGQASSLRRAYISLDAYGSGGLPPAPKSTQDGIYRIDDTTQYLLMDTSGIADKSIYSIAYYGTYASGKLLAGERTGYPCSATVPTWFTDSPTTCPIPCWYPALKSTTGAANQGNCTLSAKNGMGAAVVDWNADGSLAIAATGSLPATVYANQPEYGTAQVSVADRALWFQMQTWNAVPNDESAFAISRNNGETWNELSLIDTTIDWFNDVAVAPDCTTIYLASVNRNVGGIYAAGIFGCNEFDSVWRATINPNVAAPLPAIPSLGTYWERVYTRTTSGSCAVAQSDLPILRVVPSCTDKQDGEIVGWAAQDARATAASNAGVMAWSPDYGDYWANVTPRFRVQDFAFESSTTLYVVSTGGLVQRLPYTGTSWSTNLSSYDTVLSAAHTIVAVPDGKVLVGAALGSNSDMPAAYSADKGVTFGFVANDSVIGHGNEHVIFDVDFKNNNFIYVGDDAAGQIGTVYRNTATSGSRWVDNDMMSLGNGAYYNFANVVFLNAPNWPPLPATNYPPHIVGQFGIVQAWTGEPQPALYSAHDNLTAGNSFSTAIGNSAVCRTLQPRDGMPKPGVGWDCLDIFAPLNTQGVMFTLEPTSLKYCGCCTLDTNTTLYAIDDERGLGALRQSGMAAVPGLLGRWNNHLNPAAATTWDPAFPGYTPSLKQGMLWAYTDCLAKKGPILKSPADKQLVGADPVTGRNQQIDLSWEQLCLSTWYQLQIAKDAAFTMRINPSVNFGGVGGFGVISAVTGSILLKMDDVNMTSPAAWLAPGQLPEAGAIYYWRIRSARSATSQIAASPWSEVRSFTVKAGFIVNTPYYGVQLLAPNNACTGCKVKPTAFSWSPWKEATKYQIDIATDPEFKSLVVTSTTTSTGYEYSGTLNYSTNYFWRVKALEVNGQNIPSDWSATFSLQTEPARAPPAPAAAEPPIPVWVWVLIAIGAILVIATLVLVFKTRRI